jgi:hypothetical protein
VADDVCCSWSGACVADSGLEYQQLALRYINKCVEAIADDFGKKASEYPYFDDRNKSSQYDYLLQWACDNGFLSIVKQLYPKIRPVAWVCHALNHAAANGHPAIVKYLLEQGERLRLGALSYFWLDPEALSWASLNGHKEVVRILCKVSLKAKD